VATVTDLPTASQLQQIINTWKSTNELGYVAYAFSAAGCLHRPGSRIIRGCLDNRCE
jgi:hypothetical protein